MDRAQTALVCGTNRLTASLMITIVLDARTLVALRAPMAKLHSVTVDCAATTAPTPGYGAK